MTTTARAGPAPRLPARTVVLVAMRIPTAGILPAPFLLLSIHRTLATTVAGLVRMCRLPPRLLLARGPRSLAGTVGSGR